MKRAVDFLVATSALIALFPLCVIIAIVVAIVDGPPVLYRQRRAGRDGIEFELIKFRTMIGDSEDPSFDEHRITKLGAVLRSTSLDELPSLVNVVRGTMSLVGPRPLPTRYVARYSPGQARRLEVRPGITGLAQVRGRNAVSWEERFSHDLEYVENQTALLDAKILWATFGTILSRRGISAEGHATMREFEGDVA